VPAIVLASLALPGLARADADPASDTLYVGRVFLPLSARVSPQLARQLAADTLAAEQAGRPVRVALIASRTDLGGVPALFGRPTAYAAFLAAELQFVYPGRVLIVMPQGAALGERGRLAANPDVVRAKVEPGVDGLARTAIALVEKLADVHAEPSASGPLPSTTPAQVHVAPTGTTSKRAGGLPAWGSALIAVGALALLLVPGIWVARRRAGRPTEPAP